ncbi:tetratricopeptide repeat protein [uncultured Flavobacterium sp.]|uniref:tetratricopeptide repeat protein n=1 Tax=uncultured Flavobacterium sp. TaxID=165435 RepID=UPI0025EC3B6B|nr:tetratricopeptide repeat protein [uncultured Flavobacterium sp.]
MPLKKLCLLCLIVFFACLPCAAQTKQQCDTLSRKGQEAYNKRDYAKAMEYYAIVHSIAEKKQWLQHLFWAKNNIGVTYYSMMDYGEALNYFLDAYKIAVKDLGPENEMAVLSNMSLLYTKEKDFEKAGEFIKKAFDIASDKKDYAKMALFGINLANNANYREKPVEAQAILTEVAGYNKDAGLKSLAEMLWAESELLLGNTAVARHRAQKLYDAAPDRDFNDIGTSLQLIIARSYNTEGSLDKAREVAQQMLSEKPNVETQRTVYELLIDIYSKKKQFEMVSQYKDSVFKAEKEVNELRNGRIYENNKVKFEIESYKNEIGSKEEKLQNERKLFYALAGIVVAAFIIAGMYLRNRSLKYWQQKILAEQTQKITALELDKQISGKVMLEQQIKEKEAQALLEEERLRNEIESRNRELSSKELYISGRNQLIEDIIKSLSENPRLVKDPTVLNHIRSLKSHIAANNDWENFVTHFEQVNNGMLQRLKELHPSLTVNDIRFIAYVYMNLSIKEISAIFNITPLACAKRKERVIAKLGISKDVSLYSYISGI